MDIAQLNFTSKPGKTCNGCLFDDSRAAVCREACAAAVRASMPDCDDGGFTCWSRPTRASLP